MSPIKLEEYPQDRVRYPIMQSAPLALVANHAAANRQAQEMERAYQILGRIRSGEPPILLESAGFQNNGRDARIVSVLLPALGRVFPVVVDPAYAQEVGAKAVFTREQIDFGRIMDDYLEALTSTGLMGFKSGDAFLDAYRSDGDNKAGQRILERWNGGLSAGEPFALMQDRTQRLADDLVSWIWRRQNIYRTSSTITQSLNGTPPEYIRRRAYGALASSFQGLIAASPKEQGLLEAGDEPTLKAKLLAAMLQTYPKNEAIRDLREAHAVLQEESRSRYVVFPRRNNPLSLFHVSPVIDQPVFRSAMEELGAFEQFEARRFPDAFSSGPDGGFSVKPKALAEMLGEFRDSFRFVSGVQRDFKEREFEVLLQIAQISPPIALALSADALTRLASHRNPAEPYLDARPQPHLLIAHQIPEALPHLNELMKFRSAHFTARPRAATPARPMEAAAPFNAPRVSPKKNGGRGERSGSGTGGGMKTHSEDPGAMALRGRAYRAGRGFVLRPGVTR